MNGYQMGYELGLEKDAQLGLLKYVPRAGKALWEGLKWLGRGGRRVASTPIGGASRRAVAGVPTATRPIWGRTGKFVGGTAGLGAGWELGGRGAQKLMGTTPEEVAAAAAKAEGAEVLGTQAELQRRAREFQQEMGEAPGAAAAKPGVLERLQTPIALGQTGLKFNPLYGLLGGAAGLGLGTLAGGREEDEEGRPRRRSLLTNPLVLALLLGAGGGLLPGMMGSAGKGEVA